MANLLALGLVPRVIACSYSTSLLFLVLRASVVLGESAESERARDGVVLIRSLASTDPTLVSVVWAGCSSVSMSSPRILVLAMLGAYVQGSRINFTQG